MISLFVALLALSLGSQGGAFSLAVSPAYAASNAQSPIVSNNPDFHETICHFPGGNNITPETIIVGSPSVLEAHLNHGDLYGKCPILCPPGATACVGADGVPGLVGYGTADTTPPPYSQRELRGS